MQHLQHAGSMRSGNAPAYARPRREPALARQRRFSTARIGLVQAWHMPETIVDEMNRAETIVLYVLLERLGGRNPRSVTAMEEIPIAVWEELTQLGGRSVQGALRSLAAKSLVVIEEQRVARRFSHPNRYALGPGVQKNACKKEEQNLSILHPSPTVIDGCRTASGKRDGDGSSSPKPDREPTRPKEPTPCPRSHPGSPGPGHGDVVAAHFDSLATYALNRLAKSDPDIPAVPADRSGLLDLVDQLVGARFPTFSASTWRRVRERQPRRAALAVLETMLVIATRRNSAKLRPISNPAAYLGGILFNRRTGCRPEATLASFQQAEAMRDMDRAWDRSLGKSAGASPAPRRMTTRELSRHPDPVVRTIAMEADGRYGIVGDIARAFAGRRRPGGRSLPAMPDIVDLAIAIHEEAACVGADPAHILKSCMSH